MNNASHGLGTFSDGEKYTGEHSNNKRDGLGTYYFKNGNIYKGEYKNGNRHGDGVFLYSEGAK